MSSPATKEQFLKQFEQIVESVKQNRAKVSVICVVFNNLNVRTVTMKFFLLKCKCFVNICKHMILSCTVYIHLQAPRLKWLNSAKLLTGHPRWRTVNHNNNKFKFNDRGIGNLACYANNAMFTIVFHAWWCIVLCGELVALPSIQL